jgi:site-specific DNA recombinase
MKTGASRSALYARVSSEQQTHSQTIASQPEALERRLRDDGVALEPEMYFVDDGFSGSSLIRPGLERLRDQSAAGAIDRLYVHSPDRLARNYAHQYLLVDELGRCGVQVVFLNHDLGGTPEDNLLLQVQGMVAEYERAKILEQSRRGKLHAALGGSVAVIAAAPYGYRYIRKQDGGGVARYEVVPEEARVVEFIFDGIGRKGYSIGEICRRLNAMGCPTRSGRAPWNRSLVFTMLKNPAYMGAAAYGKTRTVARRAALRPKRGQGEHPRRDRSLIRTPPEERVAIPVPAIIGEDLFAAAQEQLTENRKRHRRSARGARYLLQGLLVCTRCGYSYYGKTTCRSGTEGDLAKYMYYSCSSGLQTVRFRGDRPCGNRSVRTEQLDAAVWGDVRALLSDPERVRREYERRLRREDPSRSARAQALGRRIQGVKRGIGRLIDAYERLTVPHSDPSLAPNSLTPGLQPYSRRSRPWPSPCCRTGSGRSSSRSCPGGCPAPREVSRPFPIGPP